MSGEWRWRVRRLRSRSDEGGSRGEPPATSTGHLVELEIFEQIDGGENHDPHDVDEVPVEAHRFDIDRIGLGELNLTPGTGKVEDESAIGEEREGEEHELRGKEMAQARAKRRLRLERVHEAEYDLEREQERRDQRRRMEHL